MILSFASTVSAVWSKAWPIIVAILFFGLVVMSHELGHFCFAKLFKVKVNEFAIGMGPRILKKKKGETTYALRLLPIGGLVNMEGEEEESNSDRAFCKKPVWQRFIIVAAGATINIILGFILLSIMLSASDLIGTMEVKSFTENASTQATGLQVGDKITAINGNHVFSDLDLSFLLQRDQDATVDFTVKRDGKKTELKNVKFDTYEKDGRQIMVFDFVIIGVKPGLGSVLKYSAGETISVIRIVWLSLFDLFTGHYHMSDMSGPIGVVTYIADAAEQSTKADPTPFLMLTALIAINIGVFNLLPIPALDGGRLFFMFIEMIRRKPIPPKYENAIHAVGLILLLAFMALISVNDVINLIRG
ncbi:MAG: site-2 protease family protein [Clostridiales bacterium]|nr:site-2 protease family protein [Clostridiales bacterium]